MWTHDVARNAAPAVQANSISNVNRTTRWSGKAAQRLTELLAQGNAAAVLDYLASLGQHGCPAYCPECGCPKGHKGEFE